MLTVRRTVAAVVVLVAATAGCSAGDDEPGPGPADVRIPEGVTLTSGRATVDLGQSASVIYRPDGGDRTVITVRVADIARGTPRDVDGLDGMPDGTVPYYARVSVRNDGPADTAGMPVPLYAFDDSGDRVEPTRPSGPVPGCDPLAGTAVDRGATAKGCLLFAVPEGAALRGVRLDAGDLGPVTWKP